MQIFVTVQVLAHKFALIYVWLTNNYSFQSCTVHLLETALPLQVECDYTGNLVADYQHTTPMFEGPVDDKYENIENIKLLIKIPNST